MMKLYSYYRSSTAYRVRIALNLKGLAHDIIPVNLLKGEQHEASFTRINPSYGVPVLEDGSLTLAQSLAIIEYLEESHPLPHLLPQDIAGRARVRSLAYIIGCDLHAMNNLRTLNYLTQTLGISEEQKLTWIRHWITEHFAALETQLAGHVDTGIFCHGNHPTLADICLVPQVYNALRFECDMAPFPTIKRIHDACQKLPAFQKAHPGVQPDTPQ